MLLLLLIFIIISICSSASIPGDSAVNDWIGTIDSPFLDNSMQLITSLGDFPYGIIVSIIFALGLWLNRLYLETIFILILPYIGVFISYIFKLFINRPRPLQETGANENSFISGHTIYIFLFMGLAIYFLPLIIQNKTYRILLQAIAAVIILLVSFSRIYLQAHWLSDVIASLITGILLLIPAIIIYKYLLKRGLLCQSFLKSKP
jgi:undecaprenyl-diphosphatase